MSDKITVTVSGPTGSGKTFLLTAIENMLEGAGLENVEWQDPSEKRVSDARNKDCMPHTDTEFELVEVNIGRPGINRSW